MTTVGRPGLDLDRYRARLDEVMAARGAWPERSPWIREAVAALPRDRFAPALLWRWDGHRWAALDRAADPDGWAGELYGDPDTAAITQLTGDLPTSSLSCQAVVADMADCLLLEPGQRVLELGAGAGWNAALLAHHAGPGKVTSVEVDPRLAATAADRIRAAGLDVSVVTGDGDTGWPAGAPYERVIATYAVERVPWAWVEQTAPGGRIVTPWGRLGHVALTVADDGRSASGWIQGLGQFMATRTADPAAGGSPGPAAFAAVRSHHEPEHHGETDRDPAALADWWRLGFAIRVALPDTAVTCATDADGTSAWLTDGRSSWATLSARPDGGAWVLEGGPRRLATELEDAWTQWERIGSPGVYDYGITVTAASQYTWANDPHTGPRWPTP
ncbi:methyltransferase domain-containing protein [Kitasatospora sp. MBT63]|uniref:methyltransferase domain-containing protein n=1 Tax=Kitasatospora sp. MBT63 TaxID=1444768 RepID=UPI00053B5E68|nr:methyltransferase domain-containing protein [Kitasatospora sp. MBT63]